MSEYVPKTGDRVRVTLEGEVGQVGGLWFDIGTERGGNCIYADATHVVSIEKIADPLPTTPGSVVRCNYRPEWVYFRTARGWITDEGKVAHLEDGDPVFDVLFDAGAKP